MTLFTEVLRNLTGLLKAFWNSPCRSFLRLTPETAKTPELLEKQPPLGRPSLSLTGVVFGPFWSAARSHRQARRRHRCCGWHTPCSPPRGQELRAVPVRQAPGIFFEMPNQEVTIFYSSPLSWARRRRGEKSQLLPSLAIPHHFLPSMITVVMSAGGRVWGCLSFPLSWWLL